MPEDELAGQKLGQSLAALDGGTVRAQQIAASRTVSPLRIPADVLERIRQDTFTQSDLRELERRLHERYGCDFGEVGWHGRSSHQRIVWQDQEVLRRLANPYVTHAIVARAEASDEMDLGSGTTLCRVLLDGLAYNRPSYLLSATPNWPVKPLVPGVDWERLNDMIPRREKAETPRVIDTGFMQLAEAALRGVQQALLDLATSQPVEIALWSAIDEASSRSMIDALMNLLDERQAALLVAGVAGDSTNLDRMSGQCLEVMSEYDALLRANDNRHERVLGYGLVSHALDAKHLAAVMIYCLKLGHTTYRLITDKAPRDAIERLLEGAASGTLGDAATALMRVRLQQVTRLLADKYQELGISPAKITASLSA